MSHNSIARGAGAEFGLQLDNRNLVSDLGLEMLTQDSHVPRNKETKFRKGAGSGRGEGQEEGGGAGASKCAGLWGGVLFIFLGI